MEQLCTVIEELMYFMFLMNAPEFVQHPNTACRRQDYISYNISASMVKGNKVRLAHKKPHKQKPSNHCL